MKFIVDSSNIYDMFDTINKRFENKYNNYPLISSMVDLQKKNILIEFKPKELKWEMDSFDINIYKSKGNVNYIIYDYNSSKFEDRNIVIKFEDRVICDDKNKITHKLTVESAKQFCQNHYNDLFYSMVDFG